MTDILLSNGQCETIESMIRDGAPKGLPLRVAFNLSKNQDADLAVMLFDCATIADAPKRSFFVGCVFEHEHTLKGLTADTIAAKVNAGLDVARKALSGVGYAPA